MKTVSTLAKYFGVGAIALVCAGCADRNNNGQPDAVNTGAVQNAAQNAVNTAENAVENAAPKVENAVGNAADAAGNAVVTGKVKTALIANKTVDSTKINVDTTSDNTVHLTGSVQNAAQKKLVESIAKREAGQGYKIMSHLKVSGNTSPVMNKNKKS